MSTDRQGLALPNQWHAAAQWRETVVAEDVSRVRAIVQSTRFFSDQEIDVAVELVVERLSKGDDSSYHFLFAMLGNDVAGYACYGEIGCTVGSYDLYWIAVSSEFQRRGIGAALLARTEALIQARRGRHVYIETSNRTLYRPTRDFYLGQGYELVSVLPDFYQAGDDKVTFRKILSSGRADEQNDEQNGRSVADQADVGAAWGVAIAAIG